MDVSCFFPHAIGYKRVFGVFLAQPLSYDLRSDKQNSWIKFLPVGDKSGFECIRFWVVWCGAKQGGK